MSCTELGETEVTFIRALTDSAALLWPCYTPAVKIVNFAPQYSQIGASGSCPHCSNDSYFKPVGGPHVEAGQVETTMCNAAQCEACKNFALVVGTRVSGQSPYRLQHFYPLGRPSDNVDGSVPDNIGKDFREALRCRWIEAYKATVTMCRRAIQASCLEQAADKDKKLVAQIDELASKGVITKPLKDFAHEVRLEGNDGAHPDADGLNEVAAKDADDIIEFTREYLHHVYVMPAKLRDRKNAAGSVAVKSQ